MKPKKAIEILNDLLGEGPQFSPDDRRDAVKLGIEALVAIESYRSDTPHLPHKLLPGETEE
ncbi:hypothetical protein ES703_49736 [subsurface metagenome]